MISPKKFYEYLIAKEICFFAGVPDSLLKDFCAYVMDYAPKNKHIISANEGGAVALCAGHYLVAGKPGLVYMQNSGQGNAINPLTSLVDPEVYGIPVFLLIGWRGEPGKHDEPQHVKQGKITLGLLDTLGIPYDILPADQDAAEKLLDVRIHEMIAQKKTYALVVRAGTFEQYKLAKAAPKEYGIIREDAIKMIAEHLHKGEVIVSTTGKTSRELFEYREAHKQGHAQDFLTVGSMGHASQIAMALSLERENLPVYCIDGDGAAIMHLGAMAIIGQHAPGNFKHIIINNGAHESVGGQPTVAHQINLLEIARGCGYHTCIQASNPQEIAAGLIKLEQSKGPSILEIRCDTGARENLGRPTTTTHENKEAFMHFVSH